MKIIWSWSYARAILPNYSSTEWMFSNNDWFNDFHISSFCLFAYSRWSSINEDFSFCFRKCTWIHLWETLLSNVSFRWRTGCLIRWSNVSVNSSLMLSFSVLPLTSNVINVGSKCRFCFFGLPHFTTIASKFQIFEPFFFKSLQMQIRQFYSLLVLLNSLGSITQGDSLKFSGLFDSPFGHSCAVIRVLPPTTLKWQIFRSVLVVKLCYGIC